MSKLKSETLLPEAGEGKRGQKGYLGYLLRQAAGAYRLRMERALLDFEVTQPQFSVLTMLSAYSGCSSADVARLALITPQTVSVIVANLERMGAVEREPHAVHGRIQQLRLTEKGHALLAECRTRVRALERELALGLTTAEEQAIRAWLVSIAVG